MPQIVKEALQGEIPAKAEGGKKQESGFFQIKKLNFLKLPVLFLLLLLFYLFPKFDDAVNNDNHHYNAHHNAVSYGSI